MMWWRGRGWVIPFIVVATVASASSSNNAYVVSLSFVAAAVFVFALRDWIGDGASVYSIPVRAWPPILVVFAVLGLIGAARHGTTLLPKRAGQTATASAANPSSPDASPAPQTLVSTANDLREPQESGMAGFETWARKHMAASEFRYVSNDEVWISLLRKPDAPEALARDGLAHYKSYMAISTPVKLVIFEGNARLAEVRQ